MPAALAALLISIKGDHDSPLLATHISTITTESQKTRQHMYYLTAAPLLFKKGGEDFVYPIYYTRSSGGPPGPNF